MFNIFKKFNKGNSKEKVYNEISNEKKEDINVMPEEFNDMDIVDKYLYMLENKYKNSENKFKWEKFIGVKEGISKENLNKLKQVYPDISKSLIKLLEFADGTYHRIYGTDKICLYFLGSDLEEYPYYLLSSERIINNKNMAYEYYKEYIDRNYGEEIYVDDKIISDSKKIYWLHFSDCMNNGGTSKLFIDFSPSDTGIKGQIIRVLHDRDEIRVIANSFDEYLQMLIDNDLNFISND